MSPSNPLQISTLPASFLQALCALKETEAPQFAKYLRECEPDTVRLTITSKERRQCRQAFAVILETSEQRSISHRVLSTDQAIWVAKHTVKILQIWGPPYL